MRVNQGLYGALWLPQSLTPRLLRPSLRVVRGRCPHRWLLRPAGEEPGPPVQQAMLPLPLMHCPSAAGVATDSGCNSPGGGGGVHVHPRSGNRCHRPPNAVPWGLGGRRRCLCVAALPPSPPPAVVPSPPSAAGRRCPHNDHAAPGSRPLLRGEGFFWASARAQPPTPSTHPPKHTAPRPKGRNHHSSCTSLFVHGGTLCTIRMNC